MAQATLAQVRARIVTLCGLIDGIETAVDDYPEDNEPFAEYQLPAIVVRPGPATYDVQNRRRMMVTRAWQLQLLVMHVADDVQDPDTEAYEATEPYIMAVMEHFGSRPRLENSDAGLAVVARIEGDGGIGGFNLNSARYMGSTMTLSIDTLHNVGR
jgi:hypothetical protein